MQDSSTVEKGFPKLCPHQLSFVSNAPEIISFYIEFMPL
jgi:hypothetical protein